MFRTVEHPTDFHSGSAKSYLIQMFNYNPSGVPGHVTLPRLLLPPVGTGLLAAGRAEEAGTLQCLQLPKLLLGFSSLVGTNKLIEKKTHRYTPHEHRFGARSGNFLKLHCLELEASSQAVWIMTPCWGFLSRSLRNERISLEKSKESCLENFQCKYFFHLKMLSNWA